MYIADKDMPRGNRKTAFQFNIGTAVSAFYLYVIQDSLPYNVVKHKCVCNIRKFVKFQQLDSLSEVSKSDRTIQ